MTIFKEIGHQDEYFQMKFVEFLEMLCRVALKEHEKEVWRNLSSPDTTKQQMSIDEVVYRFLDNLFQAHQVFPLDKRDFFDSGRRKQGKGKEDKDGKQKAHEVIEKTLKKFEQLEAET